MRILELIPIPNVADADGEIERCTGGRIVGHIHKETGQQLDG